jgi:tRNA A-37 threonylcarbamoyl transferase component Bud32
MPGGSIKPPSYWLTVLACAVYLVVFAFSAYALSRYYGIRKSPGWTLSVSGSAWVVSSVAPAGPAAGRVEPGDRLLAVNGDSRSAVLGFFQLRDIQVGETYRVDLERRGERRQIELRLNLASGNPLQPSFLLYSLVFFACGAALALLRPRDPQVRLMGWSMMMVGLSLHWDTQTQVSGFLRGWERIPHFATLCFAGWAFPMYYRVFSRFPTWGSAGPAWEGAGWLLYVGFAVTWPAWVTTHLVNVVPADGPRSFFAQHSGLYLPIAWYTQGPYLVYLLSCVGLSMAVTAWNYRRLRDAGSRRRIRWVVAGAIAGSTPWLVLVTLRAGGWIPLEIYPSAYSVAFLGTLAIPASLAMAVWKQQLFDIKVVVRRGLQYVLARNALRALLVVPFVVLGLSILRNPNRTLAQIVTGRSGWLNLAGIVAIAGTLRYRQRLQSSLDRRFFRESYEQEGVLFHLVEEVRQQDSIAAIADLVSARIESVLHPKALHVFYRAQERSELVAGRSSSGMLTGQQLPEQHGLLVALEGVRTVVEISSHAAAALPESERRWLAELSVQLIVPIAGRQNRVIGLLLLGERMSDEPYSATDRRLLEAIAAQIGLAYEHHYLQDQVRTDADVRRHVLAHLDEQNVNLLKECPRCGRCYDRVDAWCAADGVELRLTLPVERTLDGKYRLERALGRGGMGAVFEATDLRLRRRVAAKVMMGSLFGNQVALRRFEREARAAGGLDHANITRVYDYGSIGTDGAYLIMELVAGRTWREELRRSRVIEPGKAAVWFGQLLDGVHYAHQAGVVHRDLKPENVMVAAAPEGGEHVKIMDFGLAKLRGADKTTTESLTVAGVAMGTVGYMAPEQLAGDDVDARADIFAVGVMLVESLTGAKPFDGRTPLEVLAAVLETTYRLPGESAEARALDSVVQGCLAHDRRDRYDSAAALRRDLLPALRRYPGLEESSGPRSRLDPRP